LSRLASYLIRFFLKALLLYLYLLPALTMSFYGAIYVSELIFRILHVNTKEVSPELVFSLTGALTLIPMIPLFFVFRYAWEYVNLSFGTPLLACKAAASRLTRKALRKGVIHKALRIGNHKDDFLKMDITIYGEDMGTIDIILNNGLKVFSARRESMTQILLGDVKSRFGRWRKDLSEAWGRYDEYTPTFQWRVTTYVPGDWEKHLSDINGHPEPE
jgi:hypothetical protein